MTYRQTQFRGYAVSNITSEVKAKIKKEKYTPERLYEWMEQVATDGYKFSLTFDESNQAFQAALYCKDPDSVNAGLMLSVRHVSSMMAVAGLRTIHVDVYAGEWMTKEDFDW